MERRNLLRFKKGYVKWSKTRVNKVKPMEMCSEELCVQLERHQPRSCGKGVIKPSQAELWNAQPQLDKKYVELNFFFFLVRAREQLELVSGITRLGVYPSLGSIKLSWACNRARVDMAHLSSVKLQLVLILPFAESGLVVSLAPAHVLAR